MPRRLLLATTAACGLVAAGLTPSAFADDRGFGPGRHMDRRRGNLHWFHPLLLAALILTVALIVWLLIRRRPASTSGVATPPASAAVASPTAHAEAILAERLARSEISADDYRSAMAVLRPPSSGPGPTA